MGSSPSSQVKKKQNKKTYSIGANMVISSQKCFKSGWVHHSCKGDGQGSRPLPGFTQ